MAQLRMIIFSFSPGLVFITLKLSVVGGGSNGRLPKKDIIFRQA